MSLRIGIDLGGTKTEAIALDRDGRELLRRRVPTVRDDYQATIATIRELVEAIERTLGRHGTVGVGMPGAISPASGLVKNANSTWLIGKPFDRDLAEALGRPIRLANDADCFALSEATDGAAAGHRVVFGVILGTGVGGGIVVDGRLLGGPNAITGEWGHTPLPSPTESDRPGPLCYCGRRGCIETFLSGPALARDGGAEDPAAMERYADRLARGLGMVINILDPHAIVLGGGLSRLEELYRRVPALLPRHVFSDRVDTLLMPPRHGDSSGVRGAAWLWPL